MTFDDFKNFDAPLLKAAYRMFIGEDIGAELDIWYSSLKRYDREAVEVAIRSWIGNNRYRPTPADIILMMPSIANDPRKAFDRKPQFAMVNGKRTRIYRCIRCHDSGVIDFEDKDRCVVGVPCDCPAGHAFYSWGWLTEEEQAEAMRTKPDEYKTSVVGENWYTINKALRDGAYKREVTSGG